MKQLAKGFMSIFLALLVVALLFLVYANYSNYKNEIRDEEMANATPAPVNTPEPEPEPEPEEVDPAELRDIKLTVCGDLVCHSGLNSEALQSDGSYNYVPIMGGAADEVASADYAIVTMETAFAGTAPSGYPMFKSPDDLAVSLKNIGFDLVNTASNHCMDGLEAGLYRTLDVLDQNGLDHVGTYRSREERDLNNGILVRDINGVSIAFISYTYGTNGIPVTGFDHSVNLLYTDYVDTLSNIDYDSLRADMAAARALNTDLIIPLMHWGYEYERTPAAYQTELADFLFAEGADIILGGHVHVPEPMELRHVVDNEGNEKTGYIVYCLGNFISCQNDRYTNLTAALELTVRKNMTTGETWLQHVSYDPMVMIDLEDHGLRADWRYRLWDLHEAIASYEAGDNLGVIDQNLYNALINAREDIYTIFDPMFDGINGGVVVPQWAAENSEQQ